MNLALLAIAVQLGFASVSARQMPRDAASSARLAADSARDLARARSAQASFERARRYSLPERQRSDARCDVRLGRFCWWYDELPPTLPPEPGNVARKRTELVRTLDSLGALHPGDEWVAGMRVHYRIDAGNAAAADSVARACRATSWWCLALTGYADHVLGHPADADSAFTRALAEMPAPQRCEWRDISVLLPERMRRWYERASCDERRPLEARYWMLSRPQVAAVANEWRTEFLVRRVQARLAERAVTPQPDAWGKDAAELLLRYGWPVGWSRIQQTPYATGQPGIVGHDPVPSFTFAPAEELFDSTKSAADDGWDLRGRIAESRFAPRLVQRVARIAVQLARFRRGDSTLLAAAYAVQDDSLRSDAAAVLGATLEDGTTTAGPPLDRTGHASLMLAGSPALAGVEIADTVTRTLARARALYAPSPRGDGLALSDLLLYRPGESPPERLDGALAIAIPGDTMSRTLPIGVFWETYGLPAAGEAVDIAVTVERIDHGWLRGARQRIGLADPDSPIRVKWSDARPPADGGAASRAISLDLANVEAGRYRVTVSLAGADGKTATSGRDIQLRER